MLHYGHLSKSPARSVNGEQGQKLPSGVPPERPFKRDREAQPQEGVVKTIRVTPAMAAGLTDHIWTLE